MNRRVLRLSRQGYGEALARLFKIITFPRDTSVVRADHCTACFARLCHLLDCCRHTSVRLPNQCSKLVVKDTVEGKEERSMRNDMIEARLRRLSAKAREVYEEIEKLGERASREDANREESGAQAAALLDTLTPSDRADVLKRLV